MTNEQMTGLHPGCYRIFWKDGGSSVAAIGGTGNGTYWMAPSNWISVPPTYDFSTVNRLELIAVQNGKEWPDAAAACEIVNDFGKMEPCCECGNEYPRADLLRDGEIYCPPCRAKEATRGNNP